MVQPATRAALYGLKASHGATDTSGVQPGAISFDCLGGFAKTPTDLADLMSVIMNKDFSASMKSSWDGISVGFVDATLWKFPDGIIEPNPEFREQLVSPPSPKTDYYSLIQILIPTDLRNWPCNFQDFSSRWQGCASSSASTIQRSLQ